MSICDTEFGNPGDGTGPVDTKGDLGKDFGSELKMGLDENFSGEGVEKKIVVD